MSTTASAERLLRQAKADSTMRDLAAEAGVSLATPFIQFGSKGAIMHALPARRIDTMMARFAAAPRAPGAFDRVMSAIDIASSVMLEEPEVNRAVMGRLGTAVPSPGQVAHSTRLCARALGDGEGLAADRREEALRFLPEQLTFAFRRALSF